MDAYRPASWRSVAILIFVVGLAVGGYLYAALTSVE